MDNETWPIEGRPTGPLLRKRWKERRRIKRIYWFLLPILGVLIVIGGLAFIFVHPSTPSFQCTSQAPSQVNLTMYYDTEKQDWIEDVVKDFNKQCNGLVKVNPIGTSANQAMQDILDDKSTSKPDIWSPAGSVWLETLNQQWQQTHHNTIISPTAVREKTESPTCPGFCASLYSPEVKTSANRCDATGTPSLVKSPIVIAMWKPMAEALGWPNTSIWWRNIAALSTNPLGWEAHGHKEWGNFKFGHTNPNSSNSGLAAVISENYAAVQKTSGLTPNDVNNTHTQEFVKNVESSIIHYGDSTETFAEDMFTHGLTYLSAAVMDENIVEQANAGKYGHLAAQVVPIYPEDGTLVSDHPFAIPQASWVTPAKKTAAQLFCNFLLDSTQQSKAPRSGLQPATYIPPKASDKGTPGAGSNQPTVPLQPPPNDTVKNIKQTWPQERNQVDVMLVLDHSGSMYDFDGDTRKITSAKAGMEEFVKLLNPDDQLGFTIFNERADTLSAITPIGPKRQQVLDSIDGVTAVGDTLLFDTIVTQHKALQNMPIKDIKALVVLTDGHDTVSQTSVDTLLQQVKLKDTDTNAGSGVRVFTIAYGGDVSQGDVQTLTDIANASGGKECAGSSTNINRIVNNILGISPNAAVTKPGNNSC